MLPDWTHQSMFLTLRDTALQVRTKQEEVDHKEEVLAVLMERYASSTDIAGTKSQLNLGALGGLARQPSLSALSKASMAPEAKVQAGKADVKRLGSSRGRLDIKVCCCCCCCC